MISPEIARGQKLASSVESNIISRKLARTRAGCCAISSAEIRVCELCHNFVRTHVRVWKNLCDVLAGMAWLKVEKILKGSLDLIPSLSPSVKIQIMGRKNCLRCKGKTLLDIVNKLLKTKSLLTSTSNVCLIISSNFSANNLNFHRRWRDRIQHFWQKVECHILLDINGDI